MKLVSVALAVLAFRSGVRLSSPQRPLHLAVPPHTNACANASHLQVLASPTHQDPTIHHLEHVNNNPSRTVKALEWIGPIAPAGEVYAYYGSIKASPHDDDSIYH